MPTVSVNRNELFNALGEVFTDDGFDELCFEFGIELDEITTEKEMLQKERSDHTDICIESASEEIIYKIDIPANRYDLLCLEGIASALNVFRGVSALPMFKKVHPGKDNVQRVYVDAATAEVRPFVVCAVLRGITLNAERYESFIALQDKLHQNICRRRTLASIGTHDLDTVQGPFTYTARRPEDIRFVALNQTKEYNAVELFEIYNKESHLRPYLPILEGKPVYPAVYDSNGVLLSLAPIINGDHSKISLSTKNVFIEVTAVDLHKANVVLDTMVTMFSVYATEPFTCEAVEVTAVDGSVHVYPELATRKETAGVEYIRSCVGLSVEQLPADDIATLLSKMCLTSTLSDDKQNIEVSIPPTRSDVLHACDIMEDVAIAYGFNKIPYTVPKSYTVAAQLPVNKLTDMLRQEVARCGYTECLNFALCSHDEIFSNLNIEDDEKTAAVIANPKTFEFQVTRTKLLPGVLKTIANNKNMPLPMRLFEVSDVVLLDDKSDTGSRNERHLCAIYANRTPALETVHGILDRVMAVLNIKPVPCESLGGYFIKPSTLPFYFPGRQAEVFYEGRIIGSFGVVHPNVLEKFQNVSTVSSLEIDISLFV